MRGLPAGAEPAPADADTAPPTANRPRTASRQMIRMAAALVSAQAVSWIITVLGLVVVPRYLGTHDFGILATASAIGIFGITITSLGTTTYLVKEVARRPEASADLVGGVLVLRAVAWLVLASLVVPAVVLLIDSTSLQMAILVLFVGAAFDSQRVGATAGLQAHYQLGRTAIVQSVIGLLAQFAIVALLLLGVRLVGVVFPLFVASIASAGVTVFVFWRRFGLHLRPHRGALQAILAGSVVYVGWDLALMIFERVDVLMLAVMGGATATGYYAFAMRLAAVPSFIPAIIAGTVFPSMAKDAGDRPEQVREVLRWSTRILVVATVPMGAGIALLASDLTRIIGGSEFLPADSVVVVMAIAVPLIGLDVLLGTVLFSVDRQRAWTGVAFVAAVVNPALNLITIPLADRLWDNPALGAALATLETEFLMGVAAWWLLGPIIDRAATASLIARALLACAVMALPVLLVRDMAGAFAAIPVGALAYTGAAVALGLVRKDDVVRLLGALRRTPEAPAPTPA